MKAKAVIAIAIIAIMLVSVFVVLLTGNQSKPNIEPQRNDPTASPSPTTGPTQTPNPRDTTNIAQIMSNIARSVTEVFVPPRTPGLIESNQNVNSSVWKAVASNAWQYFRPGAGVVSETGLPKGTLDYPYFTDWDLGVYIQVVIDAQKVGLIDRNGTWGADYRLNKVLTFLETRDLNTTTGYPFWVYKAADGKKYEAQSDLATGQVDTVDTGRLFVALNNLRNFDTSLESRINKIVLYGQLYNRSNYAALLPNIRSESVSNSIYAYYFTSGFAAFWPEVSDVPAKILDNILSGAPVKFDGNITLPKSYISCEPLLCSVFELGNNPKLNDLTKQVYLAHEGKYNATGEFVAFSEGNDNSKFIYEWVVLPNGDTWKIMNAGESTYLSMKPIIYTKVAFSFLALYNTTFARNTVIYLERSLPDPTSGYAQGADYNPDSSRNLVLSISSNTNAMILSAARYAIQNNR